MPTITEQEPIVENPKQPWESEPTVECQNIFGGREGAVAILNSLETASTALGQGRVADFRQEVVTVREKIKQTRPDLDPVKRTEFHKKIHEAFVYSTLNNADWNRGRPGFIPPQKTAAELAEEKRMTDQADDGHKLIQSVVTAVREVECKTMFKPDKIVLNPKHYTEMVSLSFNQYSGYFPNIMDFPQETTLFGIKVERGLKSYVSLNPVVEYYAVPGTGPDGSLGVEARPVELRQEMTVPIYMGHYFQGHIIVRKTRGELVHNVSQNEMTAIDTLREMISEREYRRYINYGFILVQGKSGATYQVFRNKSHTKVWKGGKLIEEVCVRLKDFRLPPTDNVIAFKTMIEIDEAEFKKAGNVYKMSKAA